MIVIITVSSLALVAVAALLGFRYYPSFGRRRRQIGKFSLAISISILILILIFLLINKFK